MNFHKTLLVLFSLIFSTQSFSAEFKKWKKWEINLPDLPHNNFEVSKKKECSTQLDKPATSVFILLQNIEVQKEMYKLAKKTGHDPSNLSKMGLQVFRYGVTQLLEHIHNLLIQGKLPILPYDLNSRSAPKNFEKISKECGPGEICGDLDSYIKRIWKVANSAKDEDELESRFKKIDKFKKRRNFVFNDIFINGKAESKITCTYLKRFTPLIPQSYSSTPDADLFEEIAQTNINRDEYITSCNDFKVDNGRKIMAFQLDLENIDEAKWNKFGFKYWNSLKLFFSWAWRNAPEIEKMISPFSKTLKNIVIEDNIYMLPNGCKGIMPKACEIDILKLTSLRESINKSKNINTLKPSVLVNISSGTQPDILDEKFPVNNIEVKDYSEFALSDTWIEDFRKSDAKNKVEMDRKLLFSVNHLNMIISSLEVRTVLNGLNKRFKKLDGNPNNDLLKKELFYLCKEYKKSTDLDFEKILDNDDETFKYISYYQIISEVINDNCSNLAQKNVWGREFKIDKTGHSKWFIDSVYAGKFAAKASLKFKNNSNRPLLSFRGKNDFQSAEEVVCVNSVHCARKVLAAMVNIKSFKEYSDNSLALVNRMSVPNVSHNPARSKCENYDPWFKTNQAIYNIFNKVGKVALEPFIPGPIFADSTLRQGRMVSFKELVEEQKIHFDNNYNESTLLKNNYTEFGKLLEIPCRVNISNQERNPYEYYAFSGITIGGCFKPAGTIIINRPDSRTSCAKCTLNFSSIKTSISTVSSLSPQADVSTHFLNGMVNIVNANSIPKKYSRNWNVNPNHILDTYRRYGYIPKKCEKKLFKGYPCLENKKEERVTALLKKTTGTNIKSYRATSRGAEVRAHGCNEIIEVDIRAKKVNLPESCKYLRDFNTPTIDRHPVPDLIITSTPNPPTRPEPTPEPPARPEPTPEPPTIPEPTPEPPTIPEPTPEPPTIPEPTPEPPTIPEPTPEPPIILEPRPTPEPPTRPVVIDRNDNPIRVVPFGRGDCSYFMNYSGDEFLYIYRLDIKGITATDTNSAKWGIMIDDNTIKPIFRNYIGEGSYAIRNERVVLNPYENTLKIVSLEDESKVIEVPLDTCTH